ncbi:FAD-binding oxidoreductase [Salinarchaeum sp. IM2453]|uniref:NAD(P)/FAD-dependent oxidoreductase n=1 Tax=Salinarchaeum sp. IM2453 TaxID=2862870 RepID=UPI001C83F9D7|nr:FAD-dependent oxidoreductase [Salinarchaeum sp. IM2453]QZA88630.1 FAD-binding oxidoreductase [Salinarchaeum sp. IM2453]
MNITIIGGGIFGTGIAYFLKRLDPDCEVQLFERQDIAGGSTGNSAGIVRHHYSNACHIEAAKRGREILENLPALIDTHGGFHQCGYLIMAGAENEAQFRRNIELQQERDIDVELLAPDEITDYMPAVDTTGITVGAIEHEGGFADPYMVASGFSRKAAELGVNIHTNTPVTDIEMDGSRAVAVHAGNERYETDLVVNAAGAGSGAIAAMAGVELPITGYEVKVCIFDPPEPYTPDYPVISDVETGLYAKPETNGQFIAGGMERETGHKKVTARTELDGVQSDDVMRMGELLDRRIPSFVESGVAGDWSGVITAPPDWHELIGIPEGVENMYLATGGSGHGFKEGPGFAESIAQDLLGQSPTIDLDRYHPQRFANGNEFTGGYDDGSRS